MTNDAVITLAKAGLPDDAIVAKIRSGPTAFDLSTDGLIALKNAGVSGPVMAAMIAPTPAAAPAELSIDSPDPNVPHYPGLYMLVKNNGTGDKMVRIDATMSNQARTSNLLGYALTMGIASMSLKASVPGESARIQTKHPQPTFYAFFEESIPRSLQNANSSTWASGIGTTTSSPAEVSLVRFAEGDNRRDAKVGRVNIGGAKTGVMEKDQIEFDSEMLKPGVYRIVPAQMLTPGEYGFIQTIAGGGKNGAMSARVFDFGVEK
ncbi:hypothetical protein [Sandaracinobacteroides hominis]|uniref:hypothetical protein n=1 Tax=Sandaracinobacteroides hominis TaxID=2780086 RepID=UPI0018F77DB8|nr:hypothetical protein [Sandaracinobacteroides hominis]